MRWHNYMGWVPVNDLTITNFIKWAKDNATWALMDDMADEPNGALHAQIEDMVKRGVLREDGAILRLTV
jgi:hypothetical protein